MKKILSLLLLFPLLLAACAGSEEKDRFARKTFAEKIAVTYADFSQSEREAFETAARSRFAGCGSILYLDDPDDRTAVGPALNAVCYGRFGDCVAGMIVGMAQAISCVEVAGCKFYHSCAFSIFVFKDGSICDLKAAFDLDVLSKTDVEKLALFHKDFEETYFNGRFLYEQND